MGKLFVKESFPSVEFCRDCAVEIEENFQIMQVLELRPPDTMERIWETIQAGLGWESVAGVWV